MKIARVAVDVPLPRLFDYSADALGDADIGQRVVVPFGAASAGKSSRHLVGVIVSIAADTEIAAEKIRPITKILRDAPPLPGSSLSLARFCAGYYQKPLGEVLLSMLPPRLRTARSLPASPRWYVLTEPADQLLQDIPVRARARRRLVEALRDTPLSDAQIANLGRSEMAALRDMLAKGNVVVAPTPARQTDFVAPHLLTPEQRSIIDSIANQMDRFATHLLFGVTGSGKTEVYLHLMARALAAGRQTLVLVPEIALTPSLHAAFASRFPGAHVALQHSAMPEAERLTHWLDALTGRADIIIGTRLAAFVPLARPGLIIVDEEQDASFKQQDSLRYNARDIAIYRAREAGVPVVLSSATPSLESYQRALSGRYRMHRLETRAHSGAHLPAVRLIDTRRTSIRHGIADPLAEAIEQRLARGEQALIFLNRRGYAPVLACGACGWVSHCPDCAAHLVVHLAEKRLRCHHCGHGEVMPRACPDCGNLDLQPLGRGTQRLESTLQQRFANARILRIDGDSTQRRGSLEGLLSQVHAGSANLLVGTQILAKGHHFSNLTLVAVLNADAGLFAADYRASERLFAQLEQVAGRAGRENLPGEVWIQTRFPDHPLFQCLTRHDFAGFAASVLEERKMAGFPPFVHEAALRAEAPSQGSATAFLQAAILAAPAERDGITLFRPVPMAMPRLARLERMQVIVQSESRPRLQQWLASWSQVLYAMRIPDQRQLRWHLDIDPTEF